jgi:hypothetical protein
MPIHHYYPIRLSLIRHFAAGESTLSREGCRGGVKEAGFEPTLFLFRQARRVPSEPPLHHSSASCNLDVGGTFHCTDAGDDAVGLVAEGQGVLLEAGDIAVQGGGAAWWKDAA